MTILTFPPTLYPSRAAWGLKANTETFISPLNGTVQTSARPGSRWKATLEFAGLSPTQAAQLDAFLARLSGRAGRFYLFPHHRPGTVGAGIVQSGIAGGMTLTANGYPANTLIFNVGDFVSINGELKIVTSQAISASGGNIFLEFAPPLRADPPLSSQVIGTKPSALMMLDTDEYLMGRSPEPVYDTLTISCIEAFT